MPGETNEVCVINNKNNMGLSNLGIFHTVIGIIAIGAAVTSYVKYQKIHLGGKSGRIYFYGTTVASLSALGLSRNGGFNPGHVFSLLIFGLVLVAFYLHVQKKGNTRSRYFETFCLSFSFFLSLVPTVIFYLFAERQIVAGLTAGAVKG